MSGGNPGEPNDSRETVDWVNLVFGVPLFLFGGTCVWWAKPPQSGTSSDLTLMTFGVVLIGIGLILGPPRGVFAFQQLKELLLALRGKSESKAAPLSKDNSVFEPGTGASSFPELPETAALPQEVQNKLGLHSEPPPLEQADTDLIRQTLFESNVPTYILNQDYHLLDWNPAFEVAFGSEKFKRLRHVSQIIHCLANKEDVLAHGAEAFGGSKQPLVDFEIMEYVSPIYGRMQFTKITSRATHTYTGEVIGWNVVLNVNSVEKQVEFEKALNEELSHHVNWRIYSAAYDKVLTRFNGYREMVKRHCDAVAARKHILDLGAGTGNVSLELLKSGKKVVAVDYNEAMLGRLREKCRAYSTNGMLQVVKQNLELMHIATADRGTYDGAIMLNVLYTLEDPARCLKLVRQALAPNGILVVSGPKKDSRLDTLFKAIHQELQNEPDWETLSRDYDNVLARNQELEAEGVLYRFTIDDIRHMLEEAGFQVIEQDDQAYAGQAMFLVAKKKSE